MSNVLLKVENLSHRYKTGGFGSGKQSGKLAVDDVSFVVPQNRTFGLLGESGSGKTTVGRIIARLLTPTSGTVYFHGQDISSFSKHRLKTDYRKNVRVIFQHPEAALNPALKVGAMLDRVLELHGMEDKKARMKKSLDLVEQIGLGSRHLDALPSQLSGGEKRRISISMALATDPELIIADEPFVGLDVTLQADLVRRLRALQSERSFSMLLITHNITVGRALCHGFGIMEKGRCIEFSKRSEFDEQPLKETYSRKLQQAYTEANNEILKLLY